MLNVAQIKHTLQMSLISAITTFFNTSQAKRYDFEVACPIIQAQHLYHFETWLKI